MPNIKIKTAEAALIMGCSPQFVRIMYRLWLLRLKRRKIVTTEWDL